jgi:hypothetical protein
LKTGIGAAVAAASAPLLLHAQDKTVPADARPTVVGEGDHKYEVNDRWAKLPEGTRFGNCHGVAETADGRVLIHTPSPTGKSVIEFDPDGKFIRSWGEAYNGGAHGMQLRKEDGGEFLYFAPTGQHFVAKTDLEGNELFRLEVPQDAKDADGKPCYPDPNRYIPTNIAFHPTDGSFYVADGYGNFFVHHYDAKGGYLRTFGGRGNTDGKFDCPHGIWVDTRDASNPRVLVADRKNVRLQYFTLDGKHLETVKPDLRHPCHFDQRGDEILIPDLHGRITIIGKDNQVVTHLGDNKNPKDRGRHNTKREELVPGNFVTPHQAIWDRSGNIYVAEWLPYGRVTKLTKV